VTSIVDKLLDIRATQARLLEGEVRCEELVSAYIQRIEETKALNAYIEVFAEEAKQQAKAIDLKIAESPHKLGRLFGVVVSLKDLICYEGHSVTAGSNILAGYTSLYSSTAVARLIAEDAIVIGRVGCDEFGMGSSNENSVYGPVKNPINPDYVAGGSSGGSAASVAAHTCLVSLGSDTGGSVRLPASFCGLVGYKPTYGRISRHGLLAYASSFDQIGVIAHGVYDVACVMEVIAGEDGYDATASAQPLENYTSVQPRTQPSRVAYLKEATTHKGLDPYIQAQTQSLIDKLVGDGHLVEAVDFAYVEYLVPTYYVLTMAEASSNLSRYDGIRYGYRSAEASDLDKTYRLSRTEGFGQEVKRRILLGAFVLSAGYYDAYYAKAQKVRRLIAERVEDIFRQYDFLILPTSPTVAFKFGERSKNPLEMYLSDVYTVLANLAGVPAVTVPMGNHPNNGMPMGIQCMSARFQEVPLLSFAQYVSAKVVG
jgi:aspartyl-tRNA(Asn)/glutamyl-tRNA(Gln) amidotransferase subunit A